MMEITDELLNRYIDGELAPAELREFEEMLRNSEDAVKRLNALILVHNELKKYPLKETSLEFTSLLMKKIIRKPEQKGQKYFIFSISSFIILICVLIVSYVASYIVSGTPASENNDTLGIFISSLQKVGYSISSVFSRGNVSVIGFIFSFVIFITAYFFFDSNRRTRTKLDKL